MYLLIPLLMGLGSYNSIWPSLRLWMMRTIVPIVVGMAWFTAGISAWITREEFSQFAILAALVFVIYGPIFLLTGLLFPSILIPYWDWVTWQSLPYLADWIMWLIIAVGIVAGIYFLDAARTED
ncbi:MAG: hypothetical protein JSW05_00250 [Candidatus Thorarchaeota archaeon]|nr:MAG: hypothetical protein JSW05_00250 [Candidatus Thorarchaeota archaeon]